MFVQSKWLEQGPRARLPAARLHARVPGKGCARPRTGWPGAKRALRQNAFQRIPPDCLPPMDILALGLKFLEVSVKVKNEAVFALSEGWVAGDRAYAEEALWSPALGAGHRTVLGCDLLGASATGGTMQATAWSGELESALRALGAGLRTPAVLPATV